MANKGKGSQFERDFCGDLSRWWSGNKNVDDLFWRSSMSGGRSTVRGRKGKRTTGHSGDIVATSSSGEVLLDVITFELKRGYKKASIADLLDKPRHAAKQEYEKWFDQAGQSCANAGSYSWAVVHKRDKRDPVICFPGLLCDQIHEVGSFPKLMDIPIMTLFDTGGDRIHAMPLAVWFRSVTPDMIRKISKRV
jgi:hypothetical protein